MTGAKHGADHVNPYGAPDDNPGFCGVHTTNALFFVAFVFNSVCFVLVVFVVSFCVISISPCFWIYGFLKSPFGLLPRCSFANVYEEQYS